jgi:hypothetical protein
MIPIGHDREGKGSHPSRRSISFGDYCRELQNFRNLRFPLAGKIVEGCEEADGTGATERPLLMVSPLFGTRLLVRR